ncbi:exosortase [Marinobacter sp. LV10R520-4]|uniref:exosortase/archaeosortase family protein n=1 Tax=Marinobacter sp. LV10R520-4 TaxID=1761796 RepID=UPI000BF55128|nr:exosortase/archaeosortase family protein [Marinobacter sp. LV10R520-4]PFG54807.1 exosortase [Marinobacter sp. LV10R520-4]
MLRKIVDNLPRSRPYLVVTAIAVLIFYPTWIRLAEAWLEFEQATAHGLATAVIFLGLLLIHPPVHAISHKQLKPYRLAGAALLIATTLTWGLLELVRIDTLTYLMLSAGLIATAWALLGLARTLTFLPYALLLSLSLPIWADMAPALVDLASVVVGTWVGWFGMTAFIEGNSITLPYGRLIIADGCSGFRYFAMSIMLAMMTSILNDYRWRGWLITLVAAGTIGLIANWVRITILVVVAYETDMQSDMIADHDTMGWVVFAVFILPALYFSPVRKRKPGENLTSTVSVFSKIGAIAVVVAIALGPIALTILQRPGLPVSPWALELFGARPAKTGDLPIALDLPESLSQQAWRAGDLWILLAQSQKTLSDDKLVPYLPLMFDTSLWQLQETVQPGLRRYRNILSREQIIIGQRFQTGSRRSWNYTEAKMLQIPALLTQEKQFALIVLQMKCAQRSCDLATGKVQQAMTSIQLVR